jgi:HEAT repeat protein
MHGWHEYAAVKALGEIGPQARSATSLLQRLSHPEEFGIAAQAALMKIRGQAIEPNIKSLESLGPNDFRQAAQLLGEFGSKAAAVVPVLCERIQTGDGDDALVAVVALGCIHSCPTLSIPALTNCLNRGSAFTCNVLWALGQFEGEARSAVSAIRPYLKGDFTDNRCWAAASIWKILPEVEASALVPVSEIRELSGYDETISGAQINYLLDRLTGSQTDDGV